MTNDFESQSSIAATNSTAALIDLTLNTRLQHGQSMRIMDRRNKSEMNTGLVDID